MSRAHKHEWDWKALARLAGNLLEIEAWRRSQGPPPTDMLTGTLPCLFASLRLPKGPGAGVRESWTPGFCGREKPPPVGLAHRWHRCATTRGASPIRGVVFPLAHRGPKNDL